MRTSLALLPFFNLLLFVYAAKQWFIKYNPSLDWRQSVFLGAVLWGLWITFATEFFSLLQWLQFGAVLASHLLLMLLIGGLVFRNLKKLDIQCPDLASFSKFLLSVIFIIAITTGLIGVISAPNNHDSMTYHLSRVMHWQQNQSVAHYATQEIRQLYQNPWAEFAILHLELLGGNDRFFAWIQWFSMLGSLLGVSLIACLLNVNLRGQILTALVAATIPMGILQSVTTQNDYVLSFWLVCLISFILSDIKTPGLINQLGIGGSLSLAILTKGTAYIFAAPFLGWYGLHLLKNKHIPIWRPILIIGVMVVLVNGGHYSRNYQVFASPIKPQTLAEYDYANQKLTFPTFASNIIRNVALQVNTRIEPVAEATNNLVLYAHNLMGVNPADPAITWPGAHFDVGGFTVDEDRTGNFLHLLLTLFTIGFVTVRKRDSHLFVYIVSLILAFFLFAAFLKWQPWHSRLHLPLFVLGSAAIGAALSQFSFGKLTNVIALWLIVQAIPFLVSNPRHPLTGVNNIFTTPRKAQYFLGNTSRQQAYQMAAESIQKSSCQEVGLTLPIDYWEYPFWVFLQPSGNEVRQIRAINVTNETAFLQAKNFNPCAVICIQCPDKLKKIYTETFGSPSLNYGTDFLFLKKTE